MSNEEKIRIAFTLCDFDGQYARHVGVVMASVFANTDAKICVYLVHDDTLTLENQKKLTETARRFDQEIEFINVQGRIADYVPENKRGSARRGTYYSLMIPSLFSFDKIIYLDCDIIVNMDIAKLWNVPISDHGIAASLDSFADVKIRKIKDFVRLRIVYKLLGIRKERYFNAGVFVMNLEKIRSAYRFKETVDMFRERYRKLIILNDQEYLNYIFRDDSYIIDKKFFEMDFPGTETGDIGSGILHMACSDKPWSSYTRPGADNLYWEYLAMTAYCEDNKALVKLILDGICTDEYYHLHSSDCLKHYKKQLKKKFREASWRSQPKILWNSFLVWRKEKSAK